jgi:hypothetical protein
MSVVYEEKISFNVHLHGQMSVKMSKCLFLQTSDREFEVYNTETQFYGHMTVKHLFITQATGLAEDSSYLTYPSPNQT